MDKNARFFFGMAGVLLHPQFAETLFWVPNVLSNDFPVVIGYALLLSAPELLSERRGWRILLYAGVLAGLASIPYWIISTDGAWFPAVLSMAGALLQGLVAWQLYRRRGALGDGAAAEDALLKTSCLVYAAASAALVGTEGMEWLLGGRVSMWLYTLRSAACIVRLIAGCCVVVRLFAQLSRTEVKQKP